MATEAVGGETPTLFLRKATGLVRGWSVRDSFIYAGLATNFVTLAIYEFTFAAPAFPKGQLITAVMISGVWVSFLVVAYSGLIVTIPRAGGDYVWQTRILGSGIGFVMAVTGWWFILWLWAPIYGNILSVQFFEPLWATLKWTWPGGGAAWFGTTTGSSWSCLITIALAGFLVSLGMGGYARVQKWCFYGGLVGFAVVVVLLLVNSQASFISSFNLESHKLFGVEQRLRRHQRRGGQGRLHHAPPIGFGPLGPTMLLVPVMMFFILWPNWGSTLYGEIRGASDFRRVFTGMFGGLWTTVVLTVMFFLLVAKTSAGLLPEPQLAGLQPDAEVRHLAVSVHVRGLAGAQHRVPGHPDPGHEPVVLRLGGNAVPVLDPGHLRRRLRPGAAGPGRRGVGEAEGAGLLADPDAAAGGRPVRRLRLLLDVRDLHLDATLVIAVTFLFSAIAVVILPCASRICGGPRRPARSGSSASRSSRWPGWITIGLLVFCLVEWFTNATTA